MKMKKADVAVAIYIMAAIIMFIVPIPSWLLDILLAINISVALTILFATMFSKEVLDILLPYDAAVYHDLPYCAEYLIHPSDPKRRQCR